MTDMLIWLVAFVALYWGYCLYWGVKGASEARTASEYFIAGRSLAPWVFVLAVTATSFSAWTFMDHPGLVYRHGLPYAYAGLCAITIPFAGVLFLKRQWMLGKRFGFVTPGEMLYGYFRSDLIRLLMVMVALVFAIPFLGVQLRAAGLLFEILTDGLLGTTVGTWLLSTVLFVYVVTGGFKAVAGVGVGQCILLALGIVALGILTLTLVGGFEPLRDGIAALARVGADGSARFGATTPDGHSGYVAIPGVIQYVSDGPSAAGGAWTGVMVLSSMLALMGIHSSPAFSMWAFSSRSPRPFAWQQVWASSLIFGFILIVFTTVQGLGAHFLGADARFVAAHPELVNDVLGAVLGGDDLLASKGGDGALVARLISISPAWLAGLLAVCALAAMQSTAATYLSTAGAILTRDLLKPSVLPTASHVEQKRAGRIAVTFVVLCALLVATEASPALELLGGLALAYGLQMVPALMAVCWFPWLTRQGVSLGLLVGLIAVTVTDAVGQQWFGVTAWGRSPLTIHSAGWGIAFNLATCIIVSAMTQDADERAHRMKFHSFLREHASLPRTKRGLIPAAWIVTLVWFFFAVGPGAVIGNTLFGIPGDARTWTFELPSIWVWQLLFWALGVFMMGFLAYRMEMSTAPTKEVEALVGDIGEHATGAPR